MQLNEAISMRIKELIAERNINLYKLHNITGIPRSTMSYIIHGKYNSANLHTIHQLCHGLQIPIVEFFTSPLFDDNNLEI